MYLAFNELYPYMGLLSFILTWFAISYVLYKNPRELSKSISHHASKDIRVYRVFAVTMTAALLLLTAYLSLYLIPTANLPIVLVSLFVIAIILELLTTWIPLSDDRRFHPHAVLSNTAAFLMPVITTGLVFSSHLKSAALTVAYMGLVVMVGLLVVFFAIPKARNTYLVYQSMYILAFLLTIVLVPFLS